MAMMLVFAALLPVVLGSECSTDEFSPVDCSQINTKGQTVSGIYSIYPAGNIPVWVYCDMVSTGADDDKGGWTVIQRRLDGSVNFYRPWKEYKRGFGDIIGEYWLGLEKLYQLTRNRKYMLRVDMEDFTGRKGYALYSYFSVDSECEGYQLHVSGFKDGGAGDSLSGHSGYKFSTFDKDQDIHDNNCAKMFLGGFWYSNCHSTNPNGVYLWGEDATHYAIGAVWTTWKNSNTAISMKSITMKIKSVS
ncbi:microfibril-associated glycoprotein 4-like [Xyrauchen texanus]|uniref:microfibril-associated glycoprotein 4-like n=1 Tax=Xyrauchen texanus TaxID=154827 RepID=UPI00224204BD|nr:microfibril-associated glycoprotein 4-like [Xyrauchen texanus]XP_051994153.1 microfibril-associated glycoprotein 4-like [Xyrauchen texanus]XP_051994154.1 microfibril-associated glycoprotein 4-like [Xyrauchen texanus]